MRTPHHYDLSREDVALCDTINRVDPLSVDAATSIHQTLAAEAVARNRQDAGKAIKDIEDRRRAETAAIQRIQGLRNDAIAQRDSGGTEYLEIRARQEKATQAARRWESVAAQAHALGYPSAAEQANAKAGAALRVVVDAKDRAALFGRSDLDQRIAAPTVVRPQVVPVDRSKAAPAFDPAYWRRHATSEATRAREARLVRSLPDDYRPAAQEAIGRREAVFARRMDALAKSPTLSADPAAMKAAAGAVRAATAAETWHNIASLEKNTVAADFAKKNAVRAERIAGAYDFPTARLADAKLFESHLVARLPDGQRQDAEKNIAAREAAFAQAGDDKAAQLANAADVWKRIGELDPRSDQRAIARRYVAGLEQRHERQTRFDEVERLGGKIAANSATMEALAEITFDKGFDITRFRKTYADIDAGDPDVAAQAHAAVMAEIATRNGGDPSHASQVVLDGRLAENERIDAHEAAAAKAREVKDPNASHYHYNRGNEAAAEISAKHWMATAEQARTSGLGDIADMARGHAVAAEVRRGMWASRASVYDRDRPDLAQETRNIKQTHDVANDCAPTVVAKPRNGRSPEAVAAMSAATRRPAPSNPAEQTKVVVHAR